MLTVICGANRFGCEQRLKQLLEGVESLTSIDMTETEALDRLRTSVSGATLFATSDTVVVRELKEIKSLHEPVVKLCQNVPDATELIVYLPGVKPSSPPVKKLLALANDQIIETVLDRSALSAWVVETTEALGGQIDRRTADLLVEWVGEDQNSLNSEIKKLVSYNPKIDRQTIAELAVAAPSTTIFQMLDSMVGGDVDTALGYYRDLLVQQLDPYYVMSMICWQANAMTIAVKGRRLKRDQLVAASGVSSFVLGKAAGATKRLGARSMAAINEEILDLDYKMKTTAIDASKGVEQLIRTIAYEQAIS